MTKKEAIESIKNATKAIGLLFYEDEKFAAVKVKDGSQDVSVEGDFVKGTKVSVSSSTGSIAAPDGNYTLANGKKFSTKGGVISEVMADDDNDSDEDFSKEGETESEAKPEEAKPDEAEAPKESVITEVEKVVEEAPAIISEVENIVNEIKELRNEFAALKEAFATKEDMKVLGENFTAIKSAFEVLSDTPAEFSKVDKSFLAKEEKAKKLEALAGLMKK